MHANLTLTLLVNQGAPDGKLPFRVHLLAVDVRERCKVIFHQHLSRWLRVEISVYVQVR